MACRQEEACLWLVRDEQFRHAAPVVVPRSLGDARAEKVWPKAELPVVSSTPARARARLRP